MLGLRTIAIVTGVNNAVEERGKESPGFLISSDDTAGLDMRVTLVINSGLNAMAEVDSKRGGLILEGLVKAGVSFKRVSHEVGVLRKIGAFVGHRSTKESCTLLFGVVLLVATSGLNPLRKFLHSSGESLWRI